MKQKISLLDRKLSASKGLSSQARTLTEHNDADYDNDEVKFGSEIGTEDQNQSISRRRCESEHHATSSSPKMKLGGCSKPLGNKFDSGDL